MWWLLLIFCGTMGAVVGAVELSRRRATQRIASRLAGSGDGSLRHLVFGRDPGPVQNPKIQNPKSKTQNRERDFLPFVTQMLARRSLGERLQIELVQAGLKIRPSEYLGLIVLSTLLLGLSGLLLPGYRFAVPMFAVLGFCWPQVMVKSLIVKRMRKFENQLPDALTLIASSLRSGYSFLRAIQVVGQEMPDPISEEFRRAVAESNLGVPTEQALGGMVERVPSYDLDLAVTAVNIQLQVGGNLAQILDTIAATIRDRVRNQREIAALTAEGKLSGWVCAGMPPIMGAIMTALNPEYMKPLFSEAVGLMMIGVALGLQLVGGLVIKKMLSIDV
jgi:tight adherence protein B